MSSAPVPIRDTMKVNPVVIALPIAAFALILVALVAWNPVVSVATLVAEAALAAVAVKGMGRLKAAHVDYAVYRARSEGWLISLGTLAMASFFSLVVLLMQAGMTGVLPSILAAVGPLAFLLYLLLHNGHEAEPTIYDPFIKKVEQGK